MEALENMYDVTILGTGPAGLQAAIHASRRKASVIVLGREHKSSAYGVHIENYCCIAGASGEELISDGRRMARDSGAVFLDEDVTELAWEGGHFHTRVESGATIKGSALVLAMGVSRKKIGVSGEKEFLGKGLSYCVDCDATFYKGEPVAVVGCESAAVSGALTLLFYCPEVHLICKRLEVTEAFAREVRASAILLHEGRKVDRMIGDSALRAVVLDDGTHIPVGGVFIEQGAKGAVELAAPLGVNLDPDSMQYLVTDKNQQTNVPGVFAAGDICGPPWQIAKAVGEGCIAGLQAASYAKRHAKKPKNTRQN